MAAIAIQKEDNIYKEIENHPTYFKKTVAQVLVHLHRNDYVAAVGPVRESYSTPGSTGVKTAMIQQLGGHGQQDQGPVSVGLATHQIRGQQLC